MKTATPWWLHFARLGSAVGIGVGVFAGASTLIPGPWTIPIAAVAALANVVTHYANAGIASEQNK
jgi:hypothetical protein